MDLSISKNHASRAFAALLALTICSGIAHANTLAVSNAAPTLTCDTATGAGASATITVTASPAISSATAVIAVGVSGPSSATAALPAGLSITAPSIVTLAKTASSTLATSLTYTINVSAAGCAGLTTGALTFNFTAKAGTTTVPGTTAVLDVQVVPVVTVTHATSGLSVAATATVTCTKTVVSGGSTTYAPGPAVTLNVSSISPLGTPFTVDTTTALPTWLSVTPLSGGTATTSTPVALSLVAPSGCTTGSSVAATGSTYTLSLANSPASDVTLTVTFTVTTVNLAASPLSFTPTAGPSISYVKGSGNPGTGTIVVSSSSSPSPFFTVDTTTLPVWLTATPTSGTAGMSGTSAAKTITFSSTSACDTIAPGTYTASIGLKVSGYGTKMVPVTLLITNSNPTLSIAEGTTRNLTWVLGASLPTPFVTAVSTDSPIPYTVTTGGPLAPIVATSEQTGLAYSFGTPIPITFSPLVFASAVPGTVLTGTVSLTWGSPATTTVVTFNYTVLPPGATLTNVSPASIPTSGTALTTFTVVLSGTGFIVSSNPLQKTTVGIVSGGVLRPDSNVSATVTDVSHITVVLTVPSTADSLLPFSPTGSGGPVVLGVCNPNGSSCTTATGTATVTIGNAPLIQAVSSASTFAQISSGYQSIAPYDMLSIFGSNFCSSAGTGCTSSQVLSGSLNSTTLQYANYVTPDTGSTPRKLQVAFYSTASTPVLIAYAPILFATNNQINVIAPSALYASIGNTVGIVVSFGTTSSPNPSATYIANVVATDPGIYTVGSDGQGGIAALNGANYSVISSTNPAGVRSGMNNSDVIDIYVTGLGVPDSTNSGSGTDAFPADCLAPTSGSSSYLGLLNTAAGTALTTLDGVIIQSALLPSGKLPPCVKSTNVPTVTVGGVAATVKYAGWVADSVAGLYQMNVLLPVSSSSFQNAAGSSVSVASPVQLPIVVTSNSLPSQLGATVWVSKQLKVVAPTTLTGSVGTAWSSSNASVVASLGTSAYTYALTSGLLPAGLSLTNSGVNAGLISGTPIANTAGSYTVTVTATDSSSPPVTGSVTFTLTISGGLYVTSSVSGTILENVGTAASDVTTVAASGGLYPYTYAITAPGSLPAGLTVGASSGIVSTATYTPAGVYAVTVQATDASTLVTGSTSFTIDVNLLVSYTGPTSVSAGSASAVTTVTATGANGTVAYSLDATSLTNGFTIDSSTGVVTAGATTTAGTYSVTVTATDGTAPTGGTAAATSVTISGIVLT